MLYAGRLQLIQSVLFSIQVYWAGLFILPKKVSAEIDQIFPAFLWKGTELKKLVQRWLGIMFVVLKKKVAWAWLKLLKLRQEVVLNMLLELVNIRFFGGKIGIQQGLSIFCLKSDSPTI